MKCQFPDCQNPHVAKGYCHGHYAQLKRGKTLSPLSQNYSVANKGKAKKAYNENKCSADGCKAFAKKKGYCNRHYMQLFRGQPLNIEYNRKPSRRKTEGCSVEGCLNPHFAKGFCRSHYYSHYYKKRQSPDDWLRKIETSH